MKKYIKVFHSRERFNNEKYYYNIFRKNGFKLVPRISINTYKKKIEYLYIDGNIPNIVDTYIIVDYLVFFYSKRYQIISMCNEEEYKIEYINTMEFVLKKFNLNSEIIKKIKRILTNKYRVSIFKDSKLDNWIKTIDNEIIMIDFDYVVPSFFLQDFAQYFTSLELKSTSLSISYCNDSLQYFLLKLNISINEKDFFEYKILFISACLMSNLKKIEYNILEYNIDNINELNKKYLDLLKKELGSKNEYYRS
ncbi:MAG TPA: hypothetical protein EYG89_03420 [Bacteroidia bacterium]|nr:hypothetical protein [Bacteroidia bacterium]